METSGTIRKHSASKLQANIRQQAKETSLPYELPRTLLTPKLKTLPSWQASSRGIKINIPGLMAGS